MVQMASGDRNGIAGLIVDTLKPLYPYHQWSVKFPTSMKIGIREGKILFISWVLFPSIRMISQKRS